MPRRLASTQWEEDANPTLEVIIPLVTLPPVAMAMAALSEDYHFPRRMGVKSRPTGGSARRCIDDHSQEPARAGACADSYVTVLALSNMLFRFLSSKLF